MTGYKLSNRSENNLIGIHPDLLCVVRRALQITSVDFGVIEGLRTRERQQQLVKSGASQTMNSRHLTGHAIDLFAYPTATGSWEWKYYEQLSAAMKAAAKELNISLEWGGDWKTFKDGPHFQLTFKEYPV